MKAIVMEEPGKLVFRDVPDVSPGTGEVKLKIRATGICGSDIPGFLGISGRRIPPMIMGHEFSGEVVELGAFPFSIDAADPIHAPSTPFAKSASSCEAYFLRNSTASRFSFEP